MTVITQQHTHQVILPPLVEVLGIIARLPFVEGLIDDQETHTVAEIEELRGRRIVTAADGVDAELLEDLQLALHRPQRQGGTKRGVILMDAEALDFQRLAVEKEPPVGGKFGGPDAKRALDAVHKGA